MGKLEGEKKGTFFDPSGWFQRIGLVLSTSILGGCAAIFGGCSSVWDEDVKLSDGREIVVVRTIEHERGGMNWQ